MLWLGWMCYGHNNNSTEEGFEVSGSKSHVHFGFQSNDKKEPSNLEEAICKICCKKVPVESANATNLKQSL